jgi:DUF3048 family protein
MTMTSTKRRAQVAVATGLLAALGLVGGCTGDDGEGNGGSGGGGGGGGGGSGSDSELSPFTGEETDEGPEQVLAIKIDNAGPARPQTGLDDADIVYVEQVEGGLSRLLAVYSSEQPDEVGPVRSGRESDLELLEQFGDPAFAYSGIQGRLQPLFDEASIFPVTPSQAPDAYERAADRPAPYNLFADPQALLDAAPDAGEAADIGFRFGEPPARGGTAAEQREVSFPAASVSFDWSADEEHWSVSLDGEATDAEPATVVVQNVTVRESQFHDVNGVFSPFTETTGSGTATVLRDGRAYDAEWSRPDAGDGTEFTTPDGEPMRFDEGPVWVVLQAR